MGPPLSTAGPLAPGASAAAFAALRPLPLLASPRSRQPLLGERPSLVWCGAAQLGGGGQASPLSARIRAVKGAPGGRLGRVLILAHARRPAVGTTDDAHAPA